MRGRILFNGNMGNVGALCERARPWIFEAAPEGRAPRVLLVTAAWGAGEYGEGAIKAALNAVGVPSAHEGGYDRNISNLCAWHVWQSFLARRPDVAALVAEIEAAEEAIRTFYLDMTSFHAQRIRAAVRSARQAVPGFSLGRVPVSPRQALRPSAVHSGRELFEGAIAAELAESLAALVANDDRMLAALAAADDQLHARSGLRLDPQWRAERDALEARILSADVLFFFGGSPTNLLAPFHFFDLRPTLLESLRRGATFVSVSAGSLFLCERMIVYDDYNADPARREFRLHDRGFGLVGGLQIMPHCMDRIHTDDPDNLAYLARRFSTHVCAGLNEESFLLVDLGANAAISVGERDGVYVFGPSGHKLCYRRGERIPLG